MALTSDRSELAIIGLDQPVDEAALIEERRKRREAIKAKHRLQESPLLAAVPALATHGHPNTAISVSRLSRSHALGMLIPEPLDLQTFINLLSVRTQLAGINGEAGHRPGITDRVLDSQRH